MPRGRGCSIRPASRRIDRNGIQSTTGGGASMNSFYDLTQQMLVVGIPAENKIVIFGNRLLRDGFE